MADNTHVADLLAEVFRRGGMKRALRRAQAVLLWPQVAGSQLARFTRARKLVDGVLIVDVPDSETAMHLTLQRQRLLDVFQGKFGAREVRDIRFGTGRAVRDAQPETAPVRVTAPIDPHELSSLTRALSELELPEELSRPAFQAARSMLAYRARRKAEGWVPCRACAALTPRAGLCSSCERYASEPKVRSAAAVLAVHPEESTPRLSEEQRSVAAHLAEGSLEATLAELLPQVLGDPALRPQLETAARCYLALRLGKPTAEIDDGDLAALPVRVARVLGHWRGER